ncbi:hypothetical protein I7I53_05827 [Histoplasma capsulatum var. duboisii H88]|uniref:Uncharacterized protein n=1 Tax=Ajellomyces capsulatus (strain H88) TaxID=544711 RepID=A0A8A1LXU2_AJEC8|nr:hypothetical protein I7I53_05827 [Histoplasma capsulatum var. duboisii H88]
MLEEINKIKVTIKIKAKVNKSIKILLKKKKKKENNRENMQNKQIIYSHGSFPKEDANHKIPGHIK